MNIYEEPLDITPTHPTLVNLIDEVENAFNYLRGEVKGKSLVLKGIQTLRQDDPYWTSRQEDRNCYSYITNYGAKCDDSNEEAMACGFVCDQMRMSTQNVSPTALSQVIIQVVDDEETQERYFDVYLVWLRLTEDEIIQLENQA